MIGGWKDYWNRGYDANVLGMSVRIPARMIGGLRDYIMDGVPTGGFLRAVLENNLVESYNRGDDENIRNMAAYAAFLWNEAPADAWGSSEKMAAWIKAGGYNGIMKAAAAKKEEPADDDDCLGKETGCASCANRDKCEEE